MSKPSAAKPAFLALSCVVGIAPVAHAQDAGQQSLGGMTVTDTAIDEPSVKAERAESPKYTRPLLDTPQTITVITNKSIQQQNLLTLRDVLQTVPGITFGAGEGGFGYGDRIILRGVDAKSDVTVDGVRSAAFLNRNETYNIEQIEVTNGANSVISGGGSVAGTINLVTKKPLADDQYVFNAGIGTDNYYRATADVNKRINDLIAVRLNAVYHENDVPGRDVESYKRWGIAPSITIGVDSPTSLTIQLEHLDDKGMPQYGLRYYPAAGGFLSEFDRSGYYGWANVDQQNSKTTSLQAIFSHEFSDSVKIRNLTRYENIKQHTITSQPSGTFCLSSGVIAGSADPCPADVPPGFFAPNTGNGRGNTRFIRNETAYNQLDLTADFATGGIGHTVVLGGSLLWEGFNQLNGNVLREADGTLAVYPLVNIANPGEVVQGPAGFVYGSNIYTGPINFIRASRNIGERTVYSAYLFDTVKFSDMFELNGGIRYDRADGKNRMTTFITTPGSPNLGEVDVASAPLGRKDNLFSYRIGAVFKPTPDTSLYIAHGTSKLPSQASVDATCTAANCNLKPETTNNYEIGFKADLFDKALLLNVAAFRNDRDQIKVASGDPTIPDQAVEGKQRVEGFSVGASGNITENWTISANYMYLKSKIRQGVSDLCLANPGANDPANGINCSTINSPAVLDPTRGYSLTNAPKHSGSLFTTYRFPFGLEVGYGLTYQGKFLLNQPTLLQATDGTYVPYHVPSYTIHRFMVNYAITENLTAQLNIQNFTNKKYVTTVRNNVNNSWAQPAPTRSAVFSVNYAF